MSSIRSRKKVSVDNRDAERLGDLFHNRVPTEDQLECLLTLLTNYDRSAIPSLVNSPITKYANQTSMHLAAKGGLYHCLEILLINGGDPNKQEDLRQTPLHLAAAKGFAQCIWMLIDYGACTDIKDFNSLRPVDLARGKKRCEKAFEDAKAQKLIPLPMRSEKEQWTVQELHKCVCLDAEQFHLLYQQQNSKYHDLSNRWLDFCQQTLLYRATEVESVSSVELILELSPGHQPLPNLHSGDTPLLAACRKKNHKIATLLLAHSPKLLLLQNKESGHSALHLSALNGDYKMIHLLVGRVRQLLGRKEFTYENSYLLDPFDAKEVTPVFIACKGGHKEIVKILVGLQNEFSNATLININRAIGVNKETTLHVAVEKRSMDIVQTLLSSKDIDVNVQAKPSEHTCNHLIECCVANATSLGTSKFTAGSVQIEVKLSDKVADLEKTDIAITPRKLFREIYITPLAEACVYGSKAIVELLLQHGAVDKDGLACSICRSLSNFDLEQTILSYHCAYGAVTSVQLKNLKAIPDTSVGLKLTWNSMNLESCNRAWLNDKITYIMPDDTDSTGDTSKLATYDYRAVKAVNLSKNDLNELPLELFCLPNVIEIDISHNKVATLPVNQYTCLNMALCGWDCKYLEVLNLSYNELKEFPSCIWMLPNLREIHSQVNHLVIFMDPSLNQISAALNLISFSNNRLKSVSEVIWLLKSLKELNLSDNHLSISDLNFPSSIKAATQESDQDTNTNMSTISTQYQAVIQSKSASSGYESVEELTFGYRRNIQFFECHYSSLYKLNIANNELTEFPEALSCIAPNLQELDISDNIFDSIDIQLIPQLTTKFVARNCKIKHFGNVMEKKQHDYIVTSCCSVFENNNSESSLCQHRSHQQLPFLKELDLSENSLIQMQLIHCSPLRNPDKDRVVQENAFLANTSSTILLYPNLEVLNLEQNNLTGSFNPNIGHHSQLKSLLLSGNKNLVTLPNELGMLDLAVLGIRDTPSLIDPPQEYQMVESHDNLSHLLHFLKARLRKSVKYRSIKLFFIGKEGRGKTTLQHRLRSIPIRDIKRSTTSTVGIDINQWCYPEANRGSKESVEFLTWDFAGQDVYHTTHQCFYSRRSLYLALFRLTDGYQGIKELEPWLKNVKLRAPGCPVIIIGTYRDRVNRRDVLQLEQQAFQEYNDDLIYPEVAKVTSISSTQSEFFGDMKHLRALIYDVTCHLQLVNTGCYLKYNPDMKENDPRALLNQQIPHSFVQLQDAIREELLNLRMKNQPPIMEEKEFRGTFFKLFNDIAELEEAVRFLTLQGTLLHFEDHQLKMYYFLDPQWMAKLMAKVIQPNSPAKDGISEVDTLLIKCNVPEILRPIYISLLEKFEVAMVTNQQHIIIPSLMPSEAELDEQALELSTHSDFYQPPLRRFWYSDYIPNGFWPRLICRVVKDLHIAKVMHTMIDDDPEKLSGFHSGIASDKWKIWKTGICFVHGNQILFVLKQESNLKVNPSSIQVNIFEEKFRIELHLYLNQLFTLTQDKEHPLSQSYITGLATNLLVMISQHVELLVQSWFPCMLKTKSNSSTITHVPCWKCYAGIGFDDLSSVCHHIPGCFLFTSRNPVFCFVLEEDIILSALGKNLHCPIHNELEFLHMMPDHLFVDVNAVFEDSRYTLFDDSNRILGKGGFGFVFEGELRSKHDGSGKKVAVKVFVQEMEKYMEPLWSVNELLQVSQEPENVSYAYKEIRKEVYFLSSLSNPYITGFCGVKTDPYMGILLELAPKKSLRFILKEYDSHGIVLEPITLKNTALQIAKGLKYLHSQQVVHLDVKSANILVWCFPSANDDRSLRVRQAGNVWIKIADYGISQQVSTGLILKVGKFPSIGTPGFIAPELLENTGTCMEISSEKIDAFAYGMTLYEMLSFCSPFYNEPLIRRNSLVCEGRRPILHGRQKRSPILYQELMTLCWKHEPHQRPSMSQIEEWIDDPEFEKLRTMITLKDNAMISCACVCCIHNFSAGDEMENYELCTQIWVCGYTHSCNQMDLKAKVEVFVYKDGQTKRHCDSFDMSFIGEVTTLCPVGNNMIWIGLKSSKIVVLDAATLTVLYCGILDESSESTEHTQPISNIMYIDREENSIVLVMYKDKIWSLLDEISQDKFYVLDTYPLSESDHCRLVSVDNKPNIEVWGAMENNVFIFERECTGWRYQELAVDSMAYNLGLSSSIVHTHFIGQSGLDQNHIWISYSHQSVLVSFDVITRKQRCTLDCSHSINEGAEINAILAAERKIFVGTSCGKVVVLNSETKMFLVAYSWHEGKIDKLLLLPDETKPSICAEIPLNKSPEKPLNSSQTHSVSIINNIHSIPNPEPNAVMIISIGEGRVQHDVTPRSTNEVTNSHLMIWKS